MSHHELKPLIAWLELHPGLTANQLAKAIKGHPCPDASTARQITMSILCLKWKLRYLELAGEVRQKKGKWYAA